MRDRLIRAASHKRVWMYLAIGVAVSASADYLLAPRLYRSSVSFMPAGVLSDGSASPSLGSLGKMASQFGFDIGGGVADPSYLFPAIVHSNKMGAYLLDQELPLASGGNKKLLALIDKKARADDLARRERAIGHMNKALLGVSYDKDSSISTLSVVLTDKAAAFALAQLVVAKVDSFYSNAKRAVAEDRQNFILRKLETTSRELEDYENDLREFQEANRQQSDSPRLFLEESRLSRKVAMQQEIYTNLKSQEIAVGIQSSSSLSQILIVDGPSMPQKKISPTMGRVGLKWAAIYGALVSLCWVIAQRGRNLLHGAGS